MRVFAFQRATGGAKKSHDGGLTINVPAPKEQLVQTSGRRDPVTGEMVMSDDEYDARVRRSAEDSARRKGATSIIEVDTKDIPTADYDFRDAWVLTGKKIKVDQLLAKTVIRNKIRKLRAKRFDRLDDVEEWSTGDILTAVKAEKQRLRDLPASQEIEDCKTLADLRRLDPEKMVDPKK